jgi:hypothetical protein
MTDARYPPLNLRQRDPRKRVGFCPDETTRAASLLLK